MIRARLAAAVAALGLAAGLSAGLTVHSAAADPAAGWLRPAGQMTTQPYGHTTTVLNDGSVLVLGNHPGPVQTGPTAYEALRARHTAAQHVGIPDPDPKLWDPAWHGWRRLTDPDCRGHRFAHTATELADGRVLIGGGICDQPRMLNDETPREPHLRLSLWDPASKAWAPAGPALRHERLLHTASSFSDDSVMFVGGMADPALHEGAQRPVTDTVERFDGQDMKDLPPLRQARAAHAATALRGGSLLVTGGFDASGHAIESVELWQPAEQRWTPLPPMRAARYEHSATLLADGRVLVAGGIGADGQALRSTEILDGARWTEGPVLPWPMHAHAAAALADGSVLIGDGQWHGTPHPAHQIWRWKPDQADWQPAGRVRPDNESDWATQALTIAPRADGTALVFAVDAILRWTPAEARPAPRSPVWASRPTIVELQDQRVLLLGLVEDERGREWQARLWQRDTDTWSAAVQTTMAGGEISTRALLLASGRVLHAGLKSDGLACETWAPGESVWRPCQPVTLETRGDAPLALGLLPGGAAVAMVSSNEVLRFDPATEAWSRVAVRWQTEGLTYGAPIRAAAPLAEIEDQSASRWIDISDVAARYWQGAFGHLGYRVVSNGLVVNEVESRAAPPAMLWDAKAGQWAYIFLPGSAQMGADAQFLPDGCAVSSKPLAVFDPRDGKARPLDDPGLGASPGSLAMRVLSDGHVVFSGVPHLARDPGGAWLVRKVGCAGFEAAPGDEPYMQPVLARPPVAKAGAPAASAVPVRAADKPSWILAWVGEHRWLLLAVLGPLAGYVVLRMAGFESLSVGGRRWPVRLLGYGLVLIFVVPAAVGLLNFTQARRAEACEESARACLDERSGLIKVTPELTAITHSDVPTRLPCRMIGVWSSRQGGAMRRIELKDDGSYDMAPSDSGIDGGRHYTGVWAVQAGHMVWRHDQYPGPLDVNTIEDDAGAAFTLREVNGTRTKYEQIRAVASTRCAK